MNRNHAVTVLLVFSILILAAWVFASGINRPPPPPTVPSYTGMPLLCTCTPVSSSAPIFQSPLR